MATNKEEYYSRLKINPLRRYSLGVLLLLAMGGFTLLLTFGQALDYHWLSLAVPICLFGGLFILVPPVEVWDYQPWQTKPRKVEKQFDRF